MELILFSNLNMLITKVTKTNNILIPKQFFRLKSRGKTQRKVLK